MSSEDSFPSSNAPKSKQERIRDNQRRSRARRQEYLAELERRLSECHITCREAELQRSAFVDLQCENARLRALLDYAGVNADIVENFGRESIPPQPLHPSSASLRQLKPKYPSTEIPRQLVNLDHSGHAPIPAPCDTHIVSWVDPATSMVCGDYQNLANQSQYSNVPPSTTSAATNSQMATPSPSATYEWVFSSDGDSLAASNDSSLATDSYRATGNEGRAPQYTPSFSPLARAMLEQFAPNSVEIDEIRRRLAAACGRPDLPGQGIQIHDQVLIQILNEMNAHHADR